MKNKPIILLFSILLNIFLIVFIFMIELKTHLIERVLAQCGIIESNYYNDDKNSPDYWARFSWTNTIEKLHIDFDIAFLGNSITRGSDFQLLFPDKKIINLGYSGDKIKGMVKRVDMIKKTNAKKVFIMAGTNDLNNSSLDEYEENYITLVQTIMNEMPDTRLYLQSILPSNHKMANFTPNTKVQQANLIIEKIASEYNCQYINLYDKYVDENNELPQEYTIDGIHISPKYYNIWGGVIKPYIYE